MEDIKTRASELSAEIDAAMQRLDIARQQNEHDQLKAKSQNPDFWSDAPKAQASMKDLARLESRIGPWTRLDSSIRELLELVSLNDSSLENDLQQQLSETEALFLSLKTQLKFSGPYDDHDAIVSIYAGAGGTDAQDWTQMLFRMYSRWTEKNSFSATVFEESSGEEAGLKSITFEVSGDFVFGKLKGEHGVHRLVRLSPFNSDNLRQTSFAKVEVLPKIDKPDEVEIDEKELKIDVYRSGGKGGQSVNTTDSAVRVTHLPTGIVATIQNERSQLQNKETAMTILRSKLAQLQIEQHAEDLRELKGPNEQAAWGNQIRSYVLHPYKQVKDLRTRYETSDPEAVLDGDLAAFIDAYLDHTLGQA